MLTKRSQFSDISVATFINHMYILLNVVYQQPPKQTFPPCWKLSLGCVRLLKPLNVCFSVLASATDRSIKQCSVVQHV